SGCASTPRPSTGTRSPASSWRATGCARPRAWRARSPDRDEDGGLRAGVRDRPQGEAVECHDVAGDEPDRRARRGLGVDRPAADGDDRVAPFGRVVAAGLAGPDDHDAALEAGHDSVAARPKAGNSDASNVVISAISESSIRSRSTLNARNSVSPGARR